MRSKIIILFVLLLSLSACQQSNVFSVEGEIKNAEQRKIFLVHQGLTDQTVLDSVGLDTDGKFYFKVESPEYPDFYLLKVGQKQIVLAVDSIEKISLRADYDDFLNVEIENSNQSKEIQLYRNTAVELSETLQKYDEPTDVEAKKVLLDSLQQIITTHKSEVKKNLLSTSHLLSTYYALFQKIDENYLFTPYDKEDLVFFRALATAFDTYMPDYGRSKNLHNTVMEVLNSSRLEQKQQRLWEKGLSNKQNFIDIKLKDRYGYFKQLSELIGRPIVLDFAVYGDEKSSGHIFDLRELYDAFHGEVGFYQVSVHANRQLWEEAVSNKPWISVNDQEQIYFGSYNIQSVPTTFLLDAEGNIKGRYDNLKALKKELEKLF